MKLKSIPAAATVLGALTVLSSACGGGSGGNGEVIATITYMDSAGLHDIHETIVNTGNIPADARTVATRLQTVTLLTDWPGDLDADARTLAGYFAEMAKVLDSDAPDKKTVEAAAEKAHDGWHDFSHEVWDHLAKEAKIGASHGDDDHK